MEQIITKAQYEKRIKKDRLDIKRIMKITNNSIEIVQQALDNFEKKGIVVTGLQIDGEKKLHEIRVLFDELVQTDKKRKLKEVKN